MKKAFMEPELKVTKFEYEDIMVEIGSSANVGNEDEFPDWSE